MNTLFGFTRSTVQRDHALLTPASHVFAPLPGWTQSAGIVLISPQMGHVTGPRFSQYLAVMDSGGRAAASLPGVERFVFVVAGLIEVDMAAERRQLSSGGYVYIPPDAPHSLRAVASTRLNVFEKRYCPRNDTPPPPPVIGQQQEILGQPFEGDHALLLQILLPNDDAFDMAVNIMNFAPGATLPIVEVHVMEHGLLMLGGQGIYRLGDAWYPVQQGDAIWMASYCPQWFTPVGKATASYLLYKDVNRDSLEGAQ